MKTVTLEEWAEHYAKVSVFDYDVYTIRQTYKHGVRAGFGIINICFPCAYLFESAEEVAEFLKSSPQEIIGLVYVDQPRAFRAESTSDLTVPTFASEPSNVSAS